MNTICRENHPPETFQHHIDEGLPEWWDYENDGYFVELRCKRCGFTREYVIARNYETMMETWTDSDSPNACPHPEKIGFSSESEALAGAEVKGEFYDSELDVYFCCCGLWHMTTIGAKRRSP
jgi:hypothetical protein